MEKLLLLMGQDPFVSVEAQNYSLRLIPALFGAAISKPLVRFLQTQSLVFPMVLSSFIVLCFHVPMSWVLIYKLRMGSGGAAIAICVSNWLYVLVLVLYIKFSASCKNSRLAFSTESFRAMGQFFWLAIPSAVMVWYLLITIVFFLVLIIYMQNY